jgi:hypothetical protein
VTIVRLTAPISVLEERVRRREIGSGTRRSAGAPHTRCASSTRRLQGVELAHRSGDRVDVTLVWMRGAGRDGEQELVVCVCDRGAGLYFANSERNRTSLSTSTTIPLRTTVPHR